MLFEELGENDAFGRFFSDLLELRDDDNIGEIV